MKTTFALVTVGLVAVVALSGCSSNKKGGVMTKRGPDEFRVVRKAPLTLPPDYNLRPPAPGEARPQELTSDAQARIALFGQDYGKGASKGEQLLVKKAGGEATDTLIRSEVDFETMGAVHRGVEFTEEVIRKDDPDLKQAEVDPELAKQDAEAIQDATGGGKVVIERKATRMKLPGL